MIYKNKKIKAGLLLAFLFLFALGQNANAATVTAVADGNWAVGATWSSGTAPALGDDVVIPTGITVTIGADVDAADAPRTITINGTGSLVTGANALNVAQNAAGGIYINGTSATALNANGATALVIGTATFAGNLHNLSTGTVNLTGATVTMSGTLTNSEDGTLTTTAATLLTLNGSAAVVLPDEIAALHSLTVIKAGSSVTLTADLTVAAAGTLGITSGTLIVGDNDLTVGGATTIAAGATLNANSNETVTRVFTGAITLNGTLNSAGESITNTFTAVLAIPATGVLTVNNSKTTFGNTVTSAGAGAVIHALGADVTFGGIVTWTNLTLNTNSNTDLTFQGDQAAVAADNLPALTCKNLTFGDDATLTGNITAYGNVTNGGTLVTGANTLTVYGTFDNSGGTVTGATSTFIFYGPITSFGTAATNFTTAATTKITIDGSGALPAGWLIAANQNIGDLNMSRSNETLTLTNAGALTINSLVVNAGKVIPAAGQAVTVTTTTNIGTNGTLVCNGATSVTFAGPVLGTGTIDASNAADELIVTSGNFAFSGNLITGTGTILTFSTAAAVVTLPSSVTNLEMLSLLGAGLDHIITLSNDLTLAVAPVAASWVDGSIIVNGYTLTIPGAAAADATFNGINATNGSTLIFTGAAVLTNLGIVADNTTNFEFQATPTLIAAITECNNFTLKTAGNVTLLAGLDIHGNLTVGTGCTLDKATFDLTVYGDVSNTGTMTLSGAGGIVTLYGSLQGEGTYTTTAATNLIVKGTGSQLVLPYTFGATAINSLTIDRPSGVKINSDITIGAASTGLTITKGNLDLNGYVVTLGNVASTISETPGNTIINTGASGDANGFITTATTTDANIIASGIGVSDVTSGGNLTVRRYPITVPIPEVGLSTARIFQIVNVNPISAITFQFDNTELYSSASDLKVYSSTVETFATNTNLSDVDDIATTVSVNTPSDGFGRVALTETAGALAAKLAAGTYYIALAALPSDGGVMKKFAVASGNWGEAANWTPTGVPSKFDQAVIGASTVYLNGNGNIYECKVLNMNHAQAELKPTDNGINGDNVSLRVMGNVTVVAGAEILGVNGYGKLSLIVGDGVTAGVSSTITTNSNYVPTSGIWIHNLTIDMAEVNFAQANEIRVSGNVTLKGNTFLDGAKSNPNLVFWGGYGNQTITIPMNAAAQFHTLKFDNDAYVTTTASFDIKNQFTVKDGSSFIAQNGFITFPDANTNAWEVEEGGTLKLFNVVFNAAANDYTPVGTAYIQGDFTKSGGSSFKPTGTTIFSNNSQKEIVNASPEANVIFDKLQIAEGSKVATATSWQVASEIDVKNNASLIAENGIISFVNAAPAEKWIKNASTHTLEFYDLNIGAGTVYTNDSWTIHGNLVLVGNLIANNGTITFDNYQEKSINNGGTLSFFKLLVADGSKLTTNTTHNFTIANNATYPTGAGIEVQGTGQFYVGAATAATTFDVTGPGLAAGFPKTITKSEAGKLEFGNLVIAATPNNEVTTASDFTITGTAAAAYNNKGAGAKFLATAGTVTFTGAAPQIESVSPAVSQFYNILGKGAAAITFPNAGQEIMIAGDLVLNDQSTIAPNATVNAENNKVIFNGSGTQYIKGNTIALNPALFGDFQINKANNSELILEIDAAIADSAGHELTLTNGILNLGNKTFTVGAGIISRHNGVINGGTGTYVINPAHQTPKLEDVYFTVNGTPTLYNLTVNAVHATANDLTVNGDLHLIADLTIADGPDAYNPRLLTLYGNLSRTAGAIAGSETLSRLVLTGTGTVENGLSNDYFGGAATTAQLEVARQETLGGDLNIADGSFLRINTGINNFDLGTNNLTIGVGGGTATSVIMISGGIKAGTGSTVTLEDDFTFTPPSMFRDEECYNLTIAADLTIGGNLRINGTLTGLFNIFTNDNVLTFGPLATLPAFTDLAHVVGNLKRYVKNNPPTVFNIGGDGTAAKYTPITLQFANSIQGQAVLIKPVYLDPTEGRGGDPKYCVDAYFEIIPEGEAPVDSLKAIFQWNPNIDGGTTPSNNASFPAKWTGSSWFDYRNKLQPFNVAATRVLTMASFPIGNPAALAGIWGIFNASENTDVAKDRAIATDRNRVVITNIEPIPVKLGLPFKTTVQLQNHLGQPIVAEEAFEVQIQKALGNGTADLDVVTVTATIQPGKSDITIGGMMFTGANGEGDNFVLKADTTGGSLNWQMGVSEPFSVIPAAPTQQANTIKFTNIKPTSVSIDWTAGSSLSNIVVMKANSLLNEDEYPVNANTYLANTIYGAGSTFGDAVVVYNGATQQVDITGLAPNTTYYVYVFTYDGEAGYESYNTTAAAGNPNQLVTTGSYDDDITYGINNTRALSKAIGTNTPVCGTIKSETDEDWFNFTITSASPNLRVKLFNLPENYNVELYDQTGKRVRRSYLPSQYVDSFIMNELSSGTYTVRVYGQNSIFDAVNPYTLQVTTSSSEIFSVTP